MITLWLYTTLGCHLCEQLEAMVHTLANDEVALRHIEISDDDELIARYGVRIPVLVDAEGFELDRGLDHKRLSEWLRTRGWLDEAALEALLAPPQTLKPAKPAVERNGRRYLG
ncbi:glutaredoxin family protein [Halomonas vilamensis]|uniref:Glutaredoxin family protein n=1 Tax=Vreelandella vilamensis TaxID=531309 RepID=A0ABU1H2I1_9GAMM|nr:glutaredoxin family protein [Halomonas vilamensis]MDR5897882.1 glutaredoxin family protein [Halomonas vilamensis]